MRFTILIKGGERSDLKAWPLLYIRRSSGDEFRKPPNAQTAFANTASPPRATLDRVPPGLFYLSQVAIRCVIWSEWIVS
jgi:hypothetical protein